MICGLRYVGLVCLTSCPVAILEARECSVCMSPLYGSCHNFRRYDCDALIARVGLRGIRYLSRDYWGSCSNSSWSDFCHAKCRAPVVTDLFRGILQDLQVSNMGLVACGRDRVTFLQTRMVAAGGAFIRKSSSHRSFDKSLLSDSCALHSVSCGILLLLV